MPDEVLLATGFTSPVELGLAALNDLDSIPSSPGWYAWIYIPSSLSNDALKLYRHAKVEAEVSGIFNLSFAGNLESLGEEPSLPPLRQGKMNALLATLRSLFLAFAPPLYIGMSSNLKTRLLTHRRKLQDFHGVGRAEEDEATKEQPASDTEKESQYFGARIALAMRELKLSPDDLFVKFVVSNSTEQLRPVESLLNYSLTPNYGRR
jgi:hypothetical protein